jgi:hypothetical protein
LHGGRVSPGDDRVSSLTLALAAVGVHAAAIARRHRGDRHWGLPRCRSPEVQSPLGRPVQCKVTLALPSQLQGDAWRFGSMPEPLRRESGALVPILEVVRFEIAKCAGELRLRQPRHLTRLCHFIRLN